MRTSTTPPLVAAIAQRARNDATPSCRSGDARLRGAVRAAVVVAVALLGCTHALPSARAAALTSSAGRTRGAGGAGIRVCWYRIAEEICLNSTDSGTWCCTFMHSVLSVPPFPPPAKGSVDAFGDHLVWCVYCRAAACGDYKGLFMKVQQVTMARWQPLRHVSCNWVLLNNRRHRQ